MHHIPPTSPHEVPGWFDWAYKGVDHTLPGNGGPECRDFLSFSQRCWESAIASMVGLCAFMYAYPRLCLPVACPSRYRQGEPVGKRVLLLLMCLTFGIELGFKFSTRQVIWIGNPCHLASMVQIFMLAAPPSRIVTAAFRLQMHMLTGAPIALLFPVINTRLLPFETAVYFVQHILMLVIPFYCMRSGDPYIPEKLSDFKWALTSFGFLYIYHFLPLQVLAYLSQVNLNNMLCPAVSDPFHGKYYRLFAIVHQIILIPSLGKIFVILAKAFNILPCNDLPDAPLNDVFNSSSTDDCLCAATDQPCEPPCNCTTKSSSCGKSDSGVCDCNCFSITDSPCAKKDRSTTSPCCCGAPSCCKTISSNCSSCNNKMVQIDRSNRNSFLSNTSESTVDRNPTPNYSSKKSNYDSGLSGANFQSRNNVISRRLSGEGEGDSGRRDNNFVTRRLVKGEVLPPTMKCTQHQEPSFDFTSYGVDGSVSSSRGGAMSVSELEDRNGHAKKH